jgi:hypothetical protein
MISETSRTHKELSPENFNIASKLVGDTNILQIIKRNKKFDHMTSIWISRLGCVTFVQTSWYQGILKTTVFEILNLRSSNTPETVAFNIP